MATPQSIVPTLQVMNGVTPGRLYRLDREITIIGRGSDCDIVLAPGSISRKHAAIIRMPAGHALKDMGSMRGTFVNGQKLTQPVFLKDGNTIQIGELLLCFNNRVVQIEEGDDQEDSILAAVMVDVRIDDQESEKLGANFREEASSRNSLSEECAQIRSLLNANHVKWDNAERHDLLDEVLKPASSARCMLGDGFHTIVVLDAARGIAQGGVFDVLRFLAAAREEVVRAFDHRLDPHAFHIEDIFQMLKDEPRSLFCFANFQLIPIEHLRTVRSFTQGVHRVLLLTRGSRDLASEEHLARARVEERQDPVADAEDASDFGEFSSRESSLHALLVVKPEAKFRAARFLEQELGGTLVLSEVLERISNALFKIFPRAEQGFVLLKEPRTGALLPQIVRSRTGPAGELKISRTIVDRVMNAGQAILSKDPAQDFPDSASVFDSRIRSLMCVPLLDGDRKAVGIMQVNSRDGRGRFEQDDLDLFAAIASQISVAIQNAQLQKALVEQREKEQELEGR